MSRRSFRRLAFGVVGLLAVALLGVLIVDYRERVARGEQIQRDQLGRVIATRESLVKMYPGFLPTDGGGSSWFYRMAPGQFERERHRCLNPPIKVDNSGQRDPIRRENTRMCFLVNSTDDRIRPHHLVTHQIILGNATLEVSVAYP